MWCYGLLDKTYKLHTDMLIFKPVNEDYKELLEMNDLTKYAPYKISSITECFNNNYSI